MASTPTELALTLTPRSRYDAIDVAAAVRREFGDVLAGFARALYCSLHTTAGYLEQGLAARLEHRRDRLDPFIRSFQAIFPPAAGYRHDRLDERAELSADQRSSEPMNADSHLAYIGAGLSNCAAYVVRPGDPVFFMDLDGVNDGRPRTRHTRVLAYNRARAVASARCEVPVSRHPIDSINLADARAGVLALGGELIRRLGVGKGRLEITLDPAERDAGVTVNEYETLLMRHDLAEVLADPLAFAARTGRRILSDPRAIPAKSLGYARYDVVQVLNELMDALRISESAVERLLARAMAVPARPFFRLKRAVRLAVSDGGGADAGIVRGQYQNPILIQWAAPARGARAVTLRLSELS